MSFTLVIVPPHLAETADWPDRLTEAVPGIRVLRPETPEDTAAALREADAVYGALPPELLRQTRRLTWLQAPVAGPPAGFYHPELIAHPVLVTNMRDTYTDHVAAHTLALILALARGLPRYLRDQARARWAPDWTPTAILPLAEASALVVGVGALGAEIGRLLAEFGTTVTGIDRRPVAPPPGFTEVRPIAELDSSLPEADLVVLAVPHTPETEGMFDADRFACFRRGAYLVNIGRGATLRLDDLIAALDAGQLAGAALDVFEQEPLPPEHPLWQREDVLLTPHVAGVGPHADARRFAVLLENARRFAAGAELVNLVDKEQWS